MRKRKICVVTGTRAEYGLLYWTMKGLLHAPGIEMQILVTGMHLSPEFSLTYKQIEADGFVINRKVEMLLSSDTPVGISKSMGLGMIGYADALVELKPDILLLLGDRYEMFSVAAAAMISRIPIAHCHGGEATEGLIDEPIRHSITKMSHLHFTANEIYRKRVLQLGERPEYVFNVGALGIENINRLPLLSKEKFEESIGFTLGKRNFLVTFHPVTLEKESAETQFKALLSALSEQEETKIIFTKSNADTDGRIINQLIDEYVANNPERSIAFTSLGQLRYLSAMKYVDAVIGNSSSGLIEAPAFRRATINIGDRQRGRVMGDNVINCNADYYSIREAIQQQHKAAFQEKLKHTSNPYGNGNASEKIVQVLSEVDSEALLKKRFYDI